MFKIKIFPAIKEEKIFFFLEEIKKERLIGTHVEWHNGNYNLLREACFKIRDIIVIGEDMWAVVEILSNKNGNQVKIMINSLGESSFHLKEFFADKENLSLNIYSIEEYRNIDL